VRAAKGVTVLEAVMSSTPLMAAPGGWVYCVLVAAEYVAIVGSAVRIARSDRGALEIARGKIVKGTLKAVILVGGLV
jgi:hypothetical protein